MQDDFVRLALTVLCLLAAGCLGLPTLPPLEDGGATRPDSGDTGTRSDGGSGDRDAASDDAGDRPDARVPVDMGPPPLGWRSLTAGLHHACGLVRHGEAWCWGDNEWGQIDGKGGFENVKNYPSPARAAPEHLFRQVSAGNAHTCGHTIDDTVVCWGTNRVRQVAPEEAVGFSMPRFVPGISGVIELAVGPSHNCARTSTGVYCWGDNGELQSGGATVNRMYDGGDVVGAEQVVSLALGKRISCGIEAGDVHCWGTEIGCGTSCWMDSTAAQRFTSGATALAMGHDHACFIDASGTLHCWGSNLNVDSPNDVARKLGFDTAADHQVQNPQEVTMIGAALDVALGLNHSCAILSDRSLSCWGYDESGELQAAMPADYLPSSVLPGVEVAEVALGDRFTCVIDQSEPSAMRCFGWNAHGELGQGTVSGDSERNPTAVVVPYPD